MGCYGWIPMVTGRGPSQEIVYPKGSIYAIYDNIYHQYTPNVSIYTIHGSSGYGEWFLFPVACWNTAGSSQHQWMGQRNPASPKGWLKPYKSWDRPSFNWWFRNHPLNLRCPVSTCSHLVKPWAPVAASNSGTIFWRKLSDLPNYSQERPLMFNAEKLRNLSHLV